MNNMRKHTEHLNTGDLETLVALLIIGFNNLI